MTPSAPLGAAPPAGMDAATWQVLSALGDLREDIRAIGGRMDRLADDFATRREFAAHCESSERDRAVLHAEDHRLADLLAGVETRLGDRIDTQERERVVAQRWALGLAATVLLALIGFAITLFTHYL